MDEDPQMVIRQGRDLRRPSRDPNVTAQRYRGTEKSCGSIVSLCKWCEDGNAGRAER